MEAITSIIFIRMADILRSRAKNKLCFLNTMHKAIAWELFVKNVLILQHHFAMLELETFLWLKRIKWK